MTSKQSKKDHARGGTWGLRKMKQRLDRFARAGWLDSKKDARGENLYSINEKGRSEILPIVIQGLVESEGRGAGDGNRREGTWNLREMKGMINDLIQAGWIEAVQDVGRMPAYKVTRRGQGEDLPAIIDRFARANDQIR